MIKYVSFSILYVKGILQSKYFSRNILSTFSIIQNKSYEYLLGFLNLNLRISNYR